MKKDSTKDTKKKTVNKKQNVTQKTKKESKAPIVKKETKPKKRINIFKAIGNWFKEEYLELKRVSWPTRKEVLKNFIATIICVIFLGILFYAIDIIMVWLKMVVI